MFTPFTEIKCNVYTLRCDQIHFLKGTNILPIVLQCSVTLREKYELQVPENKMLRKTFGPTKDEICLSEQLRKLYSFTCNVVIYTY
jgi:hypothetical protein